MPVLPAVGGQGARPVGGDRSRESCPGYHQRRQEHRAHILDGRKHAEEFSGDRENLPAGRVTRKVT